MCLLSLGIPNELRVLKCVASVSRRYSRACTCALTYLMLPPRDWLLDFNELAPDSFLQCGVSFRFVRVGRSSCSEHVVPVDSNVESCVRTKAHWMTYINIFLPSSDSLDHDASIDYDDLSSLNSTSRSI